MTVPVTLHNALTDMNAQLDRIKQEMEAAGVPAASVLSMDVIVRNAFVLLITCQHEKTPVPDMDEALVSAISTILFDYMQRIHAKPSKKIVIDHLRLIFDDVKERLAMHVAQNFTDEPPKGKIKLVKH